MKKALVFVAVFALVLVAGAAVAFMATPGDEADEPVAVEEPINDDVLEVEKEVPPIDKEEAEEPKEEPREEDKPHEEDSPATEPKQEEETEDVDSDPPDLVILFPEDGQHFEKKEIAFEGKTEPGARVFAGKYEADVDEEGNWRIVLILTHDGANTASFKSIDEAGNESTASVKAYYDGHEEDKPKEESHEFTAHQKYGSCSEPIPYDKWYGTGEPGTQIWIASDFSPVKTTTIGESGEWSLKVEFPEAPCGDQFGVVLETNKGHRKVYEFIRYCEDGGGEGQDK